MYLSIIQQLHFGTKPIKEWTDNTEWVTYFPNFNLLNDDEKMNKHKCNPKMFGSQAKLFKNE